MRKENRKILSLLLSFLTLTPPQGFSSGETDFHFCQFLSNFLKYSFLNFLLFYSYNIFVVNFPGNSPLLKSLSSTISSFSCLLTSVFILSSNSASISFMCPKFSFFSYILYSTVNPFYLTRYFSIPLIFLLFRISSTSYSSTPSTLTCFPSSFLYPSTYSLYRTIQLTFTTR